MRFKYLADHEEAIPIIARWYFDQWGQRAEKGSVEEFSIYLQRYLNRDEIPLIVIAMDKANIVGAAQLKYREMDIYPESRLGRILTPLTHPLNMTMTLIRAIRNR